MKLSRLWKTSAGFLRIGYSYAMDDFELPAPPEPASPPQVPGYDVGRLLGRGSSAAVWLAADRKTLRHVALKCFMAAGPYDDPPASSNAEEAVRREMRVLSALDHEHLVKAHAVVRARHGSCNGLALVLEYAPGGSLAELIAARGRLGAGETVTVLTPIAQVLDYLHGQGFTHGDVSPGNVLFTAQGKPLLADLGVGRMLADPRDPQDPTRPGTDGFRDPAPVDAVRAGLQPEADIYSVAALGWFCLTGKVPEPEPERPPLPLLVPGVPPGLAEALEAGLRMDRRQRPSAAELAAAVFRSVPAAPLDLSVSVHPAVLPQLLTRRSLPATARERRRARLLAWRRRVLSRRSRAKPPGRAVRGVRGRSAGPGGGNGLHAVGLHAATPGRRRRGPRRQGPGRLARVMVLAVLAAAGLLTVSLLPRPATGPAAGRAPAAASSSASGAVPADLQELLAAGRPEDAVRGLARLRSYAFSTGRFDLLQQVTVPASSAAAADAAIASRLTGSGRVLDGFETTLSGLERRPESTAERAVVSLRAASPPYRERDAAGTVVAEAAAAGEQRLRLVLVPVEGRWRIQEILPGAGEGG